MTESRGKGHLSPGDLFERVFGNLLVRVVGTLIRLVTITAGLLFCLGIFISGLLFTVFWAVAPLVAVFSLVVGVRLII